MTREEYINALKNEILALTNDEQAEAIQYYTDYFEEANDDEKVIAELGTPKELGKTITEKFANAMVPTDSEEGDDQNQNENKSKEEYVLYYAYDKSKVQNVDLNFGIADVVLIKGAKKFTVETRGVAETDFYSYLSNDGTLTINNVRKVNLSFLSHDRSNRLIPRILISIPENARLKKFRVKVGAGNFRSKDAVFYCQSGCVDVGAGNLVVGNVKGGEIDFRCGMGNLEFNGTVTGKSDIDCGMGSIKLVLEGDENQYSYDLKLGLGDFKFNDEKKGGFYQSVDKPRKANHFSVNCGMGNVNIKIDNKQRK